MPSIAFARFWHVDLTRECFLGYLNRDDLQTMRMVCHEIADTVAPILFKEIKLDFNATCFARQARIAALGRIGHHIKTFTFSMPHTDETFLPPLLDPDTLEEVSFNYEPQISAARPTSPSKYGSWEMNDLLVRQYPLLFHAATNIPSFIQAVKMMPCLRHLRVSCPNQNAMPTHRRDIVDYALISLRIAVEQAILPSLDTLSLDPIHPTATFYLRPQTTIGSSPSSTRVWRKIKHLNVLMDNLDPDYTRHDAATDQLKSLHAYLSVFSSLRSFNFTWIGYQGASPMSLHTEPCTSQPSSLDYSTCAPFQSSSPPSLSSSPTFSCSSSSSLSFGEFRRRPQIGLRPLRFRYLRSMRLVNATFDAIQASDFVHLHRKTLAEFQFKTCHLRTGTWDDALEPLTHISGNDDWRQKQHYTDLPLPFPPTIPKPAQQHPALRRSRPKLQIPQRTTSYRGNLHHHEIMDVPLMLSPEEEIPEMEFLKDRLWKPDTLSVFDDLDDRCSVSTSTATPSSWSRRKRSMKTLRRIGEKFGLMGPPIEEENIAMEGVRRLLRGGRVVW